VTLVLFTQKIDECEFSCGIKMFVMQFVSTRGLRYASDLSTEMSSVDYTGVVLYRMHSVCLSSLYIPCLCFFVSCTVCAKVCERIDVLRNCALIVHPCVSVSFQACEIACARMDGVLFVVRLLFSNV